MSGYTEEHAGALADIAEAGAAVTFSFADPGTYTPATGAFTGAATTTITGAAIQTKAKRSFGSDGLTATDGRTLLFCPTTYGDLPAEGATVSWGGATYTVQSTEPVAINGDVFLARVVIV